MRARLSACALLLAAASAWAQGGGAVRDWRIPAGPLGSALAQLAAEAGVLFSADARLLDMRTTPGLQGRYALPQAFGRLLEGSGLELVQEGPRYTLRQAAAAPPATAPARPAEAAGPPTVLPLVTVRALAIGSEPGYTSATPPALARTDTPAQELPQSLTVLTQDFIQDLAVQQIAELLRYVPGVGAAQGEGNRDTPVFRGLSSTAAFLVDGLRDDMQYYRDLYNVERVEALRGPNAMMVGHGAVAGLINRVSKVPDWTERRELSWATGEGRQQRVTLDTTQTHGTDVASRLNLLYEESDGWRDHFHLRRLGVNPVLAWRLPGQAQLTLGFEHFQDQRTDDRGIPSWNGRPVDTGRTSFFGNPDESSTWVRVNALNAQLDLDLGDGQRLRSRLRHADYDKFFQNVFAGSVRQNGERFEVALLAHNSRMRRQNTTSQTDLTWTWNPGRVEHQLLAGVELSRQAGDNRRETGFFGASDTVLYVPVSQPTSFAPLSWRQLPTDPDSRSEARVLGLYLQDQIRLAPGWQATLGMRHDSLSVDLQDHALGRALSSQDQLWSPRAALLWQPHTALSFYAGTSIGHAPRAGEQLSALTQGNQALRPEQFVNHELGAKWRPRTGLEASAALYQLDRRNVAVTDSATGTQTLVGGQRTRGLELGLSGSWRPGWQLMGAYAWQDSRVRTALSPAAPAGATMPHVPRHSLSLWNRVTLTPQWAVGLGASVRGMVFASTDNSVRLPGYARVDAALFYTPAPGLRAQLNVENLLDRRYFAFAHSNNNTMPGAPRMFRLALTTAF
ncbi:TonB-dependent siderophore receptor [Pseudorhodoferax sp.]|uniref:TonB-dependent siderophore receptor n=1 Tax=Pseudorhodoferax sp. TaxID=1993553 RepID=UPI002DD68D7C|nr:TonB-dependent siderophore receptor [Pseudorhodoferax sp.]